jgi:hypothetical protein
MFEMETEPAAGNVAAKWRALEADIDEEAITPTSRGSACGREVLILDKRRLPLEHHTGMVGSIPEFVSMTTAHGASSAFYSVSAFCGGARFGSSGTKSATSHPPPRAR